MKLRPRTLLLPVVLLLPVFLLLHGCGKGEAEPPAEAVPGSVSPESVSRDFPLRLRDASGRTLVLEKLPRRILCLVPSGTETLLSLGARDLLVGRTEFDTAAALAHLPSVGGGLHPNPEALVALDPELVIRFAGDSDSSTPAQLDQLGIPHLAIQPNGIQDIRKIIRDLGSVAGRGKEADSLLAAMDATLGEIRSRVQGRRRLRVGYLLGGTPPWVAGPGSYIEELLEVAGGENVFSDLQALYGPVSREVFLVREMDLLLAAEGAEVSFPESGVPFRRVSAGVEIPGPHLAEAALELARVLHPEAFR